MSIFITQRIFLALFAHRLMGQFGMLFLNVSRLAIGTALGLECD